MLQNDDGQTFWGCFCLSFTHSTEKWPFSEQLGASLHTLLPSFSLLAETVRLKNYLFSFVSSFYALDVYSVTKLTCILNKSRKKPLNNTYLRSNGVFLLHSDLTTKSKNEDWDSA